MAQIIKTNGEVIETAPKNGTDFQLEELQSIVGGYIEIVNLQDGRIICLNEEGKLYNLPYNTRATDILRAALLTIDFIVGDVLVCKDEEIQ